MHKEDWGRPYSSPALFGRFSSPTRVRSDIWTASQPQIPNFGPPGSKYYPPKSVQKLPGFSFSGPRKIQKKKSVRPTSDKKDNAVSNTFVEPKEDQRLQNVLQPDANPGLINRSNNVSSGDDMMSFSSITSSRISGHKGLEKDGYSDNKSVASLASAMSGSRSQSRERSRVKGSSSLSVSSGSSSSSIQSSSGSGLRFSKKMINFLVQSPHLVSLPMLQSANDWLFSNNFIDQVDEESISSDNVASTIPQGATIAKMKEMYGYLVEMQQSLNDERRAVNPETSPEMIFFPIENVISDTVVNGRVKIQSYYSHLQQGAEMLLLQLEQRLQLLADHRRHSQNLFRHIEIAEKQLLEVDVERLKLLDQLKMAKVNASELAKDMAYLHLASHKDQYLNGAHSTTTHDGMTQVDGSYEGDKILYVSDVPKIGSVGGEGDDAASIPDNSDKVSVDGHVAVGLNVEYEQDMDMDIRVSEAVQALPLQIVAPSVNPLTTPLSVYLQAMTEQGKQRVEAIIAQHSSSGFADSTPSVSNSSNVIAAPVAIPKRKPPPRPPA